MHNFTVEHNVFNTKEHLGSKCQLTDEKSARNTKDCDVDAPLN